MFYFIVLEYAILASSFTIAKTAVGYSDGKPIFLIGIRMTLAGLLLLSYLWRYNKPALKVAKKDWPLFLQTTLFLIYLPFLTEFWALQHLTSAKTSIILYSTTPFFAAMLAYILLNQKLNRYQAAALVVGFCGLLPILATHGVEKFGWNELLNASVPAGVLLFSALSTAYAWFIVSALMKRGYSFFAINGISMLLGGLGSLITSSMVETIWPAQLTYPSAFLGWTLLLVLVANIISYNFYSWLLQTYSVTFMIFAGCLCPIFASFFGWSFLGEAISWHHFLSLAMVTTGLSLFYWGENRSTS